jgi:hypothetical protein
VKGTGHLVICLELAAKAEHVTVDKVLDTFLLKKEKFIKIISLRIFQSNYPG